MKNEKSLKMRMKEIEAVYRTLGLQSEEVRKYFIALGNMKDLGKKEKNSIFIEAATTSQSSGGWEHAGLERNSE